MALRILLALLLTAAPASAQSLVPGQLYTSPDGYVQIRAGNVPLVLTVPHNGTLKPIALPARTKTACDDPDFNIGTDGWSAELSTLIAARVYAVTGKHPWVIVNRLDRSRLDANRNREHGACGHPAAGAAWDQFHAYIAVARQAIAGRGLQIDLHSHAHEARRVELGYLLTREALYAPTAEASSLHAFALTYEGAFPDMLRALGTALTMRGFPAMPSAQDWTAEPGEAYFTGGYLTERYGCLLASDTICGVQMEHHRSDLKSHAQRTAYVAALIDALLPLLTEWGIMW